MRGVAIFGSILLVLIVVLVVGIFVVLPQLGSPEAKTPIPNQQALSSADTKMATAQQTATALAKTGKGAKMTIQMTEDELTAKSADYLSSGKDTSGFTVSDSKIKLVPDKLIIRVRVVLSALTLPVTVNTDVTAQDGKVKVTVTSVEAAGATLPDFVAKQMSKQVENQLAAMWSDLPMKVEEVHITEGLITFVGTAS